MFKTMVQNPQQFPKIDIPLQKVLARLGYAAGKTQADQKTLDIISEQMELAQKLAEPHRVISLSTVKLEAAGQIGLEPNLTIKSNKVFELLKDCVEAYGFAVTIGAHLEQKRDAFIKEKETTRALVLDAIGSVLADNLADITQGDIDAHVQKWGLESTMRFSPGYGDWEISGQKDFLAWLGAENIGIKLTPSFQMIPEKSVSAIFGIKREQSYEQK